MDFTERRLGQAAAEGGVEAFYAGVQEGIRQGHSEAAPDDGDFGGGVRSRGIASYLFFRKSGRKTASHCSWNRFWRAGSRRFQALGQRSLDLRDLAAQGKNSFPRHGAYRHDVHFRQ
ncbi:hypothetical protein [Mesorhizobium sp.]|uniref:hypothetical protein n=1 Tax=Mesorhizobium sp. TaxID=1871066 RepID=UPI0025BE8104|nr:hypothetical protein [Mesorhizobium sp.]